METILILLFLAWFAFAAGCASMLFAYFQGKWPTLAERDKRHDAGASFGMGALAGMLGPLGLFIVWCMTGRARYGLRLPRA